MTAYYNGHDYKIKQFFKDLHFDEPSHTYRVDGRVLPSVSRNLEEMAEKEDFVAIAHAIAKRDDKNPFEILDEWARINKESIDKGHKTHTFAEGDMRNPSTGAEHAVVKFWTDLDKSRYFLVGKEVRMYHKRYGYAGTSDLLLFDVDTMTYIIADYKTNKDLFKNYKGKLLKKPFQDMLDHPYNKYQIQLCMYQILLEQVTGPVSERWIIWVKDDGTYENMKGYDFTPRVHSYLAA
jgi:hypothetical protein